MEPSFYHPLALLDTNVSLADETELWSSFTEEGYGTVKYRNIPIANSLDGLKVSNFQFENLPRVKGTKKRNANLVKKVPDCSENRLILNENINRRTNKQHFNLDSKAPVNTIQRKFYSEYPSFDRIGQVSVSEPTLSLVKDRGDSITLQDIYKEEKLVPKNPGRGGKQSSNDRGFKGCIYIKNSGKIYKSLIDAQSHQAHGDDGIFGSFGVKQRKSDGTYPFANSHKYTGDSSVFGTRNLKVPKEEGGDFEIAIFLTGIKSISKNNMINQQKPVQKKKKVAEIRPEIKPKMKKRSQRRKEKSTTQVQKKNFESVRKSSQRPAKSFISPQDKTRKYLKQQPQPNKCFHDEKLDSERINKASEVNFHSSSTCESEPLFEVPECDPIKKRQPKQITVNGSYIVRNVSNPSENEIRHESTDHKFGIDDNGSYRSREMSQSSMCQFSDDYRVPKPKMKDEDMWQRFEAIFRSYASTTRHSGEVIPRKISTVWMIHTGVVGDILTVKEADSAFRQAAGAKITMNAQEYKEFLISLTIRMKLPYYEIYRRMCGL